MIRTLKEEYLVNILLPSSGQATAYPQQARCHGTVLLQMQLRLCVLPPVSITGLWFLKLKLDGFDLKLKNTKDLSDRAVNRLLPVKVWTRNCCTFRL